MSTGGKHITELSVERADPHEMAGRLMESEHRGRYWWATQLVKGGEALDAGCGAGYGTEILARAGARRVVGVDISLEAIDDARSSFSGASREFVVGDLHDLPFADDTFDLVACFEVIEHLEEQQSALSEIRRVLRPGGILAISSPNRGVYPPGNPYHTHEYRSEELRQALAIEFDHVGLYRQSPWLTSAVLDDQQSEAIEADAEMLLRVIKTGSVEAGAETFTVALASDIELPTPASLVVMGTPFEVRWWEDQLNQAAEEQDRERYRWDHERTQHQQKHSEQGRAHLEQGRALLAVETELANARNEIARLLAAEADLKTWAADLKKCAREQDEVTRRRAEDFENRLRRAERTIDDVTSSLSWRITVPLRAVKRLLSR